MLNFGQKVEEKSGDIIPKDELLWAVLSIREVKNSSETRGRYLDIELTICDNQPHKGRKIWVMIADPFDSNNSEAWRTMGYGAIRRILEAVKGASPDNVNSYTLNQLEDLHGLVVPIITTIEKGKEGYEDKNKADFLSPHSSIKKIVECYNLLRQGVHTYNKQGKAASGAPQQGSMFAGTASAHPAQMPAVGGMAPSAAHQQQPAATNAPGWLAPAGAPAQAPQQGFQQGQVAAPSQVAPNGFAAPAEAQQSPQGFVAPAQTTSPSNGGWQAPAGVATPVQFPNG